MSIPEPPVSCVESLSRDPILFRVRKPHRAFLILAMLGIGSSVPLLQEFLGFLFPSANSFFGSLSTTKKGVTLGVVLCSFLLITFQLGTRWAIHRVKATHQARRKEPANRQIAALIKSVAPLFYDVNVCRYLAGALRELGCAGRPLLIHWDRPPPPMEPPIIVPIEPIFLDESDPAFYALESGIRNSADGEQGGSTWTSTNKLLIRRLRKAYLYSGAWIALPMLAIAFVFLAIVAVVLGRYGSLIILAYAIVPMLLILSLPLFLGGPIGPSWLLVPGGLVMRKAKKRGMASEVHLFSPDQTVLLIRPLNKRMWIMHAEDENEFGMLNVSDRELTMLLRAWLSPIPPPSVEKLVDLT
ncbi:hypothetical protein B7486_09345 [cyanobacterium TDX16]|nr:hypothetical protein B7486_09345 [cyanobacterium TDX16]